MPLLLIIFLFFPLSGYAENLPSMALKAEKLYEMGDFDNSIDLFEGCYSDSQNPACISQPLIILEKSYAALPKITKHSLTLFTPEKTKFSWKDFIKNTVIDLIPSSLY